MWGDSHHSVGLLLAAQILSPSKKLFHARIHNSEWKLKNSWNVNRRIQWMLRHSLLNQFSHHQANCTDSHDGWNTDAIIDAKCQSASYLWQPAEFCLNDCLPQNLWSPSWRKGRGALKEQHQTDQTQEVTMICSRSTLLYWLW